MSECSTFDARLAHVHRDIGVSDATSRPAATQPGQDSGNDDRQQQQQKQQQKVCVVASVNNTATLRTFASPCVVSVAVLDIYRPKSIVCVYVLFLPVFKHYMCVCGLFLERMPDWNVCVCVRAPKVKVPSRVCDYCKLAECAPR